jgi:5-methylcytosine-specific restriction protein A
LAVTHGHGNPNWTKDETILALNLYFQLDGKIPGSSSQAVQELSLLLNQLPIHALELRNKKFRNPDGVAFKLQNIRSVATGVGLSNTSRTDKEIWNLYGENRGEVAKIAETIRKSIGQFGERSELDAEIDDEESFPEGKILTAMHYRRERAPGVRKRVMSARGKSGTLICDICHTPNDYGNLVGQDSIFECHHIIPISETGERKTRNSDLSLLCANCHRAIHAYMRITQMWITPNDFKDLREKL